MRTSGAHPKCAMVLERIARRERAMAKPLRSEAARPKPPTLNTSIMQRILYIADPNLIHDLKWISFFSSQKDDYQAFMLIRRCHAEQLGEANFANIENKYQLKILGIIDDFSIRHFWRTYQQGRIIRQFVKTQKIDIVHIMYAEPNALWANIALPKNVRRILTTRGTDVLQTIPAFFGQTGILSRLVAYFYRRAFARFEHITGTSTRQLASIKTLAPDCHDRLHLVRTGVDISALDSSLGKLPDALEEQPFLLFPRNMRPIYQHEFALAALAQLPKEIRQKYTLVFVHRNSAERAYVEKIEQILAAQDMRYVFLDFVPSDTLYILYKKAALVIMTPISDGTPVSAIEAMALGAPLLLPPLQYDPDIFAPDAVCMLQNWDSAELATKILAILNATLRLDTQKASQLARSQADRQQEMQKLAQLYQQK
jgi:glycosyltransferase involved in cell wall biosynthesis